MNKNIFVLVLSLIMILVSMTSCIYDMNMTSPAAVNDNDPVNNGGQNSSKIASLQMEINNASEGATINLSNYASIDVEESITINKNVTITNGNLRGSNLKILSDGVSLNNIHNTSIATNSSMKISGSSLNSLSIKNISSPSLSVTSLGRGGDATSDVKVPKVILDGTSVNGDLTVSIPKTFISIGTSSSSVSSVEAIKITAQDAQLTVTDKRSDIKAITFEKPCQIVLEDGTSDKIAAPTAADNADATAAATQIDMTSGSPTLERLSVLSGMPVFVKYGTLPDFSSLIVLGEYSVTAGVMIYKGDFCYDGDNNKIYKSESDFTVKIGDQTYYENGSVKSTAPLSSGQKDVIISKGSVTYSFKINVGEEEAPAEKKPILTGIVIKNGADIEQNVYHVGDVFSLKGLVVEGTYSYGDNNTYTSVLTGWTSEPADGTVITEDHDGAKLTVSYGSVSAEINNFITLSNDCSFTFVPYPETPTKDIVVKYVANGHTVSALTGLSRPDYKFEGWWTSNDDGETLDETFDFTNSISADTVVYAKWIEIIHWKITYHGINYEINGDLSTDSYTAFDNVTLWQPDYYSLGYIFIAWQLNSNDPDSTTDGWSAGDRSGDVELYAFCTPRTWTIEYKDQGGIPYSGSDNTSDWAQYFVYNETPVELSNDLTKAHYNFVGWYVDADCSTPIGTINDDYVSTYWINTDTIIVYAKWTPNHYTINFNINEPTSDIDIFEAYGYVQQYPNNTFDKAYGTTLGQLNPANFQLTDLKNNYTFFMWNTKPDGTGISLIINDSIDVDLTTDNNVTVTLYAIWYSTTQAAIGDIVYDRTIDASPYFYSSSYLQNKDPIGIVYDVTTDETGIKVKFVDLNEGSGLAWCADTYGGYGNSIIDTSTDDGMFNFDAICAVDNTALDAVRNATSAEGSGFPAFWYVLYKSDADIYWYLPAKNELNAVYINKDTINNTLTILGDAMICVNQFGTGEYWSSSADGTTDAWVQNFSTGDQIAKERHSTKDSANSPILVRAVTAITIDINNP